MGSLASRLDLGAQVANDTLDLAAGVAIVDKNDVVVPGAGRLQGVVERPDLEGVGEAILGLRLVQSLADADVDGEEDGEEERGVDGGVDVVAEEKTEVLVDEGQNLFPQSRFVLRRHSGCSGWSPGLLSVELGTKTAPGAL